MNKISIIIPCLNEEKYIDSCIDSIVNSNLDDFELFLLMEKKNIFSLYKSRKK